MNKFSEHLKALRKTTGMTQKTVAKHLGVVESCYANWEQGRTEPNIESIRKLVMLFEISYDDFFDL